MDALSYIISDIRADGTVVFTCLVDNTTMTLTGVPVDSAASVKAYCDSFCASYCGSIMPAPVSMLSFDPSTLIGVDQTVTLS